MAELADALDLGGNNAVKGNLFMNKRILLFLFMNILNYIMVLFAFILYPSGAPLHIPMMLISQSILLFLNYVISFKIWHIILLSLHLIISTIISNKLSIYLYMQNISNDGETAIVGNYIFWIGLAFVVFTSLISICLKNHLLESKEK